MHWVVRAARTEVNPRVGWLLVTWRLLEGCFGAAHFSSSSLRSAPLVLLQRRPELQMLSEGLHQFASHTPFLEWFVRGPDGRPVQRRRAFITDADGAEGADSSSADDGGWRRR